MPTSGDTCRKVPVILNKQNHSHIYPITVYTDTELLLAIQQQDEQAFSVLYYRYYESLCRKAFRRIPVEPVVEELVQDVFVTLWAKAQALDTTGNVAAWLYATLRNKVLHELRTEGNRKYYEGKAISLTKDAEINNPLHVLEEKQVDEKIKHAIALLPDQCKTAFVLSRFENKSYREIASIMNISIKTVEKHISKALAHLREELKEMNTALDPHIWVPASIIIAGILK